VVCQRGVSRGPLRAASECDGAAAGRRRPQARRPAAWTSEQRHALTRHVDERARDAVEAYTTLPEDTDPLDKQRARYAALKSARDRALVFVLAYTAVRVGELLRDPNDPRRRGVRWEDLSLEDGSMDVYRKKQQWDAASLPDPVISPLRSYRQLLDPTTERWPVFPTFDQRTLAGLIQDELADQGERPDAIAERREEYARDLLLALDEDIRPPSITTDGARSILQRLSKLQRSISTIRNTTILLPTAADVEWERCLSARSGIQSLLVTWITPRRWFGSATRILKLVNSVMSQPKH